MDERVGFIADHRSGWWTMTELCERYEISRKFAPYIGFAYSGKYGNTARYSRQAGETTSDYRLIFGLRLWF